MKLIHCSIGIHFNINNTKKKKYLILKKKILNLKKLANKIVIKIFI